MGGRGGQLAVAVAAVGACAVVLAGCSSGGSTPKRSLNAKESSFVTQVRTALAPLPGKHTSRSDAQIADDGDGTCGDLRSGKPDDAYNALKSDGYSAGDEGAVEQIAVQVLCPDTRAAYQTWLSPPPKS